MLVKVCVHWQWALLEVDSLAVHLVQVHMEVVELKRMEVAVEAVLMWRWQVKNGSLVAPIVACARI